MLVLGLETSCDETAAAVVSAEGVVHANVVHTQIDLHRPYGGILPELAARDHLQQAIPVIQAALAHANVSLPDLAGIAVTVRPGLAGALLVGAQVAKTLAWATPLPLVGVDHLVGHLVSVFLHSADETAPQLVFPYLGLLVSGGHTALYRVDSPLPAGITEIGATRDDAVGEAFDKVAKMLRLGYPGGPVIDQLAAQGNPRKIRVPRPMMQGLEFSFSGIKTWVRRHLEEQGFPPDPASLHDLCASFQEAVVDVLVTKTLRAAQQEQVSHIVVAGGVAANRRLRDRMHQACAERNLTLLLPSHSLCTDNAAMIAYAGAQRLVAGQCDDWSTLTTHTRTELLRTSRKGRGKRPLQVVRSN